MKKQILISLLFFGTFFAFSQTKNPTLMILPSDNWCNQQYFMTELAHSSHKCNFFILQI